MDENDDLKDLFNGTDATFVTPDVTPNVVSFASSSPSTTEEKKKKPRKPREKKSKPYERKKRVPSVLSQYSDFLSNDAFIVPDTPAPTTYP